MNKTETEKLILEKRFSIKDTGLSYRTINNWSEKGVIDHLRSKEGKWHKFNALELAEVYFYKELKKIGFSIEKIKNVKERLYDGMVYDEVSKKTTMIVIGDIEFFANRLSIAFLGFVDGERMYLVVSPDGKNVDLTRDTDMAKSFLGDDLSKDKFFGGSCVIISVNKFFKKTGICNDPKDKKKLSTLFEELSGDGLENNGKLEVTLGGKSYAINKIIKITNRRIKKEESLNKLSRNPNQKTTLYSNNSGDLVAEIKEEL